MLELKLIIKESKSKWNIIQREAAASVMKSLRKTLRAHAKGQQNDDYTKKDQYIPVTNGLNVNSTDMTIQLFGLLQSKIVLVEGVTKKTNSAPLTIEKNKIRKSLPIGKFREFALDLGNVKTVKVNGNTIEIVPPDDAFKGYMFTVNAETPSLVTA